MRRLSGKANKRKKTDEPEVKSDDESAEENGNADSADADNDVQQEDEEGTSKPVDKKKKGKKGRPSGASKIKKPEPELEEEEEFEVESVVDSRYMRGKRQFKVRWRGHGPEEDSWCGEDDLNCSDLIQEYLDSAEGDEEAGTSKKGTPGRKRKSGTKKDDTDDEKEYEVERVLEVRFKKNGKREFLIRWKGFLSSDDSWEPEEHLNCTDLINKLMQEVDKAKELTERELRVQPKQTDRLKLKNPQTRTSRRQPKGGRATYQDLLQ